MVSSFIRSYTTEADSIPTISSGSASEKILRIGLWIHGSSATLRLFGNSATSFVGMESTLSRMERQLQATFKRSLPTQKNQFGHERRFRSKCTTNLKRICSLMKATSIQNATPTANLTPHTYHLFLVEVTTAVETKTSMFL